MTTIVKSSQNFLIFLKKAELRVLPPRYNKWVFPLYTTHTLYNSGRSRISPMWGRQLPKGSTCDFAKFSGKLHEIEKHLDARGEHTGAPLDQPMYTTPLYHTPPPVNRQMPVKTLHSLMLCMRSVNISYYSKGSNLPSHSWMLPQHQQEPENILAERFLKLTPIHASIIYLIS